MAKEDNRLSIKFSKKNKGMKAKLKKLADGKYGKRSVHQVAEAILADGIRNPKKLFE